MECPQNVYPVPAGWPQGSGRKGYEACAKASQKYTQKRKFAIRSVFVNLPICSDSTYLDTTHPAPRSYISHTASTSTITCVRGILRAAASASMARRSAFIFSRLGDFRMK